MNALDPSAYLMGFGLVLTRVTAFVVSCPVFTSESVPRLLRAIVAALLSLSLYVAHPVQAMPAMAATALLVEALFGVAFGLCTRIISLGFNFAGELIDTHMGFGFARIMNPMLAEEAGPIMHLSQLIGGLVFFMAGGQHQVILGLSRSLVLFPPGASEFRLGFVTLLLDHVGELLSCGVLLAAPIVLALMATQAGLALLSRVAPGINLWAIGLIGTSGMGMLALWCYTPAWVAAAVSLWQSQGNGFLAVAP